jgi:hypothetical protein
MDMTRSSARSQTVADRDLDVRIVAFGEPFCALR